MRATIAPGMIVLGNDVIHDVIAVSLQSVECLILEDRMNDNKSVSVKAVLDPLKIVRIADGQRCNTVLLGQCLTQFYDAGVLGIDALPAEAVTLPYHGGLIPMEWAGDAVVPAPSNTLILVWDSAECIIGIIVFDLPLDKTQRAGEVGA